VATCWSTVQRVAEFKTHKRGPWVVALSKFQHFRNPRLFVIVDWAVIWTWVLGLRMALAAG
jgi:hypothetical protein